MTAREKVKIKLQERIDKKLPISYPILEKEDSELLSAISRNGGFFNLLSEMGYSEEEMVNDLGLSRNINRRTLTEDEILNRLLYLKSIGKLTTNAMRNEFDDLRLEQSIKKIYGSVENGLRYFNLERDRVRRSKQSIFQDILKLNEKYDDLSYAKMLKIDSALLHTATNIFKTGWHDILDEVGIDYSSKYKRLNKENVAKRLSLIKEKEGVINFTMLQKNDSSLIWYAYENYESIKEFYIDFGLNPNDCMDFSEQRVKGFALEQTFKKVLDCLNINYIFNRPYTDGIRPDFRLDKNTWIDCKLSAWTKSIEDTVERYTPHCNKLIIVFLRGEYKHLPIIDNPKVEFRKMDFYYPFLQQIKRQDLIEELEYIQDNNNNKFLESVTTERLTS